MVDNIELANYQPHESRNIGLVQTTRISELAPRGTQILSFFNSVTFHFLAFMTKDFYDSEKIDVEIFEYLVIIHRTVINFKYLSKESTHV